MAGKFKVERVGKDDGGDVRKKTARREKY